MTKEVTIREYGLLLKGGNDKHIECSSISATAFDWLLVNGLSVGDKARELVRIKRQGKRIALQVVNFVGVLDTPCGTRIEILPKISSNDATPDVARATLLKMLSVVEKLKLQQFHQSQLMVVKKPLIEILITEFLTLAAKIVKKGLRSQYVRVERESGFLKGQLLLAKQIRQRPGRQHYFHISHDIYITNRAENRLLCSALHQVLKWSKSTNNQRLARELLSVFHDIQVSTDYKSDFNKWSTDRTLAHYRDIKPWCKLILNQQSPISMSGLSNGVSFLFPMEMLFERYVAIKLKKQLGKSYRLVEQIQSKSLTRHKDLNWFKLRPDIVIYKGNQIETVIDTKWKVLNENLDSGKEKYNLSQSDMYQLFAYGEKYMEGKGELFLIYPRHRHFNHSLAAFEFKPGLTLNVVPYDIENDNFTVGFL
jgi:5-methylcytosine-specific restriction enzyme subunit McrC